MRSGRTWQATSWPAKSQNWFFIKFWPQLHHFERILWFWAFRSIALLLIEYSWLLVTRLTENSLRTPSLQRISAEDRWLAFLARQASKDQRSRRDRRKPRVVPIDSAWNEDLFEVTTAGPYENRDEDELVLTRNSGKGDWPLRLLPVPQFPLGKFCAIRGSRNSLLLARENHLKAQRFSLVAYQFGVG